MAHRFWEFDAAQYNNQLNHFLKNAAIIGGLLYVAMLGAGGLSLDSRSRPS
jgi:putative oxidoreductase